MTFYNKFILTSIFCLLLVGQYNRSFGQSVEMQWGDEFMENTDVSDGKIIGEDGVHYYLLKAKLSGLFTKEVAGYIIERYTMEHKLAQMIPLDLSTPEGKVGSFDTICLLDNQLVLFFNYYDSKSDQNILYGVNIEKTGKLGTPVVIDRETIKKEKHKGNHEFVVSEDKSKVLVVRNTIQEKGEPGKLKYIMLSANLSVLREKDVTIPYDGKNLTFDKYVIDENGNVFMLGGYAQDIMLAFRTPKLFIYDYAADKVTEFSIPTVPDKTVYMKGLKMFYNQSALHIVSFYTRVKLSTKGNDGILYLRINTKTNVAEVEKLIEYDKVLISKLTPNPKMFQGKGIDDNYRISDIVIREDGKLCLIAEDVSEYTPVYTSSQVTTHQTSTGLTNNGTSSTQWKPTTTTTRTSGSTNYYYKDLIVFQLSADGKIEWATRIPKNQESKSDGGRYSSYLLTYDQNNIYFLYNDSPKNAQTQDQKLNSELVVAKKVSLNKPHKAVVTLATINSEGKLSRMTMKNLQPNQQSAFVASNYYRINKNRIWILGAKGKIRKYGFVTVKASE